MKFLREVVVARKGSGWGNMSASVAGLQGRRILAHQLRPLDPQATRAPGITGHWGEQVPRPCGCPNGGKTGSWRVERRR
jgi:hypothetical protein